MASSSQAVLKFTLVVVILLVQNFYVVLGRNKLEPHASLVPKDSTTTKTRYPPVYGFSFNHYKNMETDAFRPTTQGHSPGMGHDDPPSLKT
uniref:Uncharacterized protein n=1 Tax=Nelumbo nucifera TaxID=4432 RepID=A0A822YQB2_NELNU|nr:TPA_asm: hypothetical protein HUJ06_007005 [Nelumbo nucifera]